MNRLLAHLILALGAVGMAVAAETPPGANIVVVAGDGQIVKPGSAFPQRWLLFVKDAQGRGVPNTEVRIGDGWPFDEGLPHAAPVFANGEDVTTVTTDARGMVALTPRAAAVTGNGSGYACVFVRAWSCTEIEFGVYAEDTPYSLTIVEQPLAIRYGDLSRGPITVRVLNHRGRAIGGVPVTFALDQGMPMHPPCASFEWEDFFADVATDSQGLARSPLLGSHGGACTATVYVGDGTLAVHVDLNSFDDPYVKVLAPGALNVRAGQPFTIDASLGIDGWPAFTAIEADYAAQVSVSVGANGATAQMTQRAVPAPDPDGRVRIPFKANGKPGTYKVTITYGQASRVVTVTQR